MIAFDAAANVRRFRPLFRSGFRSAFRSGGVSSRFAYLAGATLSLDFTRNPPLLVVQA